MKKNNKPYILFIDDERDSDDVDQTSWPPGIPVLSAPSSEVARGLVMRLGLPLHFAFDHDLGGDDTTLDFLRWLCYEGGFYESPVPSYSVHSQNPVGAKNIKSFMESWKRSQEL